MIERLKFIASIILIAIVVTLGSASLMYGLYAFEQASGHRTPLTTDD